MLALKQWTFSAGGGGPTATTPNRIGYGPKDWAHWRSYVIDFTHDDDDNEFTRFLCIEL